MKIRLGADPEVVVLNEQQTPVSAIPLISGTKDEPIIGNNELAMSHDNVLAEFAISPCNNIDEFVFKIEDGKEQLANLLPPRHSISAVASAVFSNSDLQHPTARKFGCSPDYNAWSLRQNIPPQADGNSRSCGGHLHIGASEGSELLLDFNGKVDAIKALDTLVGVFLTSVCDNVNVERERRELYGMAGCHRPKDYGVEYRTPSGSWIKDEKTTRAVGLLAHDAVALTIEGNPTCGIDEQKIVDIINYCDVMGAVMLFQELTMKGAISGDTLDALQGI